ncbi:13324_t:CDS:2, partial [Funneliformis geosporum]
MLLFNSKQIYIHQLIGKVKKDGNKLKRILLSDEEWDLLDQLVDLLMSFENATPNEVLSNAEEFSNENTVFETEIETQLTNFDDDEVISNITKISISIKNPLDTTGVLEKVKQNIYNALIYYWDIPSNLDLMVALLDPRYKNLDFLENNDEKKQIIQKLHNEI